VRFHLAPAIEVDATADGWARSFVRAARRHGISAAAAACLTIEDSLWIDGRGQPQRRPSLVIVGEVSALGGEIGWQFRRSS
jgi:uncharacterized heparinase superfamily protein